MKSILEVSLIAVLLAGLSAAQVPSPISGTWVGEREGSPFVILTIAYANNGELTGTGVFFILDRAGDHKPPKVLGKQEVQLLNPKLQGNVFSFSVCNQQGQVIMNPWSGDELRFQMTLRSGAVGELRSSRADTEALKMFKQ